MSVTSREYKLTLNVDDKLYKDWKTYGFSHIQQLLEWSCEQTNIKLSGKFKPFDQFVVSYLDTPDQVLYNNGWIFRARKYSSDPHNEYTLKFRCSDRYYSASKDIKFKGNADRVEYKFEEDLTIYPFSSNFSPSCNVYSDTKLKFDSFKKLADGWSGISNLDVSSKAPIVPVRGIQVIQEVWKGVNVKLGEDTYKIRVVLWWKNTAKAQNDLLFGEIMFRLKSSNEGYSNDKIIDAHNLYLTLNKFGVNTGWISSDGMTKTKYFYGR
jgi:hypothetical protein